MEDETKQEETEQDDTQHDDSATAAQQQEEEVEAAKKEMHELEEGDPPDKVEDWPDNKAKYLTYGGPEGTDGYDEGPTRKLGPSSLEHHEDGSVTIEGEKVDNPEDYKSDEKVRSAVETEADNDSSADDDSSAGDKESSED
jgi:hypothetical protein